MISFPSDARGLSSHRPAGDTFQSNSVGTLFQYLKPDLISRMSRHTWVVLIPLFLNSLKTLLLNINFRRPLNH